MALTGGLLLIVVALGSAVDRASAAELSTVKPAMACADLLARDFSYLGDAPSKLNAATMVSEGAGSPYCLVDGYVAPGVEFQVRLPTEHWTQRLLMQGCGGYCGNLLSLPVSGAPSASAGCERIAAGEFAIAGHNGGHVGATDRSHFLRSISDGAWAIGDPAALVDFFYKSNRKATIAVKAIVAAFYGRPARFAYFDGCSSGGRAALQIAERYPDDYDGILAGAPTIDNTAENTFVHAWNVRVNMAPDGTAILTADKIPALAKAVLAACADDSGMIADPRTCRFDANSLVCEGAESPSCLTPEQARAANLIWRGPRDEHGVLLAPGGMPYGSELAWIGGMALPKGVPFSQDVSADFAFSHDFPDYMSRWRSTGITNRNIEFTSREWEFLDAMHSLDDPTNPDLRAFAGHGGKLIVWQGWADSGTSPFGTLNYYDAMRHLMGAQAAATFLALYLMPGVYHCAGAPIAATFDLLTPLMAWVEDAQAPGRLVVSYRTNSDPASPIARSRAVFPYPAVGAWSGQGDVDSAANYVPRPATANVSDALPWAGSRHYRPGEQTECDQRGPMLVCR